MKNEFIKRLISSIVLIPIILYCIIYGSYYFNFLILTSFIMSVYEWNSISKRKYFSLFGIIFLSISYLTIFMIRNNFDDQSLNFFLLVLLTCIFTDLGGYIFGKIFKGPKLIRISPKKTYSGMIGAFLLPILIFLIFNKIYTFSEYFLKDINIYFILTILIISLVSQAGDIIISYFKREAKVKDTGNIIPGHGGILDRTDGMVFAFPFSYVLFTLKLF